MKTKCNRLILLFLFFAFTFDAQVNTAFLRHLSSKELKREHAAYLSSVSTTADSLNYEYAKFYLRYFNDSLFLDYYLKSRSLFLSDSCAVNTAGVLFLRAKPQRSAVWFGSMAQDGANSSGCAIGLAYMAASDPQHTTASLLPPKLQSSFLEYRTAYGKKPMVAALLSTAVPGLGKLYIGRKKSFLNTFLTHALYGVQSYESIKKLGIKNAFSILDLGFFSVFYLANIYGSYADTRQVKKEKQKQFLINASDYYNTECSCKLY